jgi:hypothetical protein
MLVDAGGTRLLRGQRHRGRHRLGAYQPQRVQPRHHGMVRPRPPGPPSHTRLSVTNHVLTAACCCTARASLSPPTNLRCDPISESRTWRKGTSRALKQLSHTHHSMNASGSGISGSPLLQECGALGLLEQHAEAVGVAGVQVSLARNAADSRRLWSVFGGSRFLSP